MIDSPRIVLSARRAEKDHAVADERTAARVLEFLRRIRGTEQNYLPCEISVTQIIPPHSGFGSGTQLGLAVARAVATLSDEFEIPMETLARRVGRGLRSAVGLHGFQQGGFLVDGGRVESNQIGTLVTRVEFPAEWRFVLAAPRQTIGLSGEAEQSAFARQPSMPGSLTAELCRIVLMDWLPAVINADFARCGESLFQFGQRVGEFFSHAQGGVIADPRMSEWVSLLRRRGVQGVAQTSWGPTVAALCSSEAEAAELRRDFDGSTAWSDCSFHIASPLNHGAVVSVS